MIDYCYFSIFNSQFLFYQISITGLFDIFLQEFFRISGTDHTGWLSDRITLKLTIFNTLHYPSLYFTIKNVPNVSKYRKCSVQSYLYNLSENQLLRSIFSQQFGSHLFNAFLCIVESRLHFFLRFPYITDHQIITRIDHIRYPVENPES